MKMNPHYSKLVHKQDFCRMLSFRLGIEKETIRNYMETNRIPSKHINRIEMALKIQSELDEKIKKMTVNAFENV